ncbi:hypothetical protein [Abyssisolibacter fermentans]|uniref:hypothetical protein n=1 Tax=Abyssisolibacter fermentans TaxID=1766203 RepID=UPI0008314D81|nr:hypothetical protein [Abyssisolibacter fermentans]
MEIRNIVIRTLMDMFPNEGNLKTAGDLYSFLKNMFKDALQEMLEADKMICLCNIYEYDIFKI